jgi:hypothetical protein
VVTRRTNVQGPFVAAPVDPGNSVTVNDNYRLTNGKASPRVSPFDSISGTVTWNPVTRALSLAAGASITLGGALYNFCSLSMGQNASIALAAGARTAVYLDSPDRQGSGCAVGSGTMSDNARWINNSPPGVGSSYLHDATALQIYVVGRAAGMTLRLGDDRDFYGLIYAPNATVFINNNQKIYGAITAQDINATDSVRYYGEPRATAITTSAGGVYFRTAWRECLAAATTSDPGSGC